MLFWILAAILTLVAALAVMYPFMRRSAAQATTAAHDIEVYRDQMGEIERDIERNLIDKDEAKQARAEIGRRILRASEQVEAAEKQSRSGKGARLTAMAAVLAVPMISWGLYSLTGSPSLPALPLQARLDQKPSEMPINDLVARAEVHLSENPEDSRGWEVLAPVYMRLGRFKDAATAYQNMIRLSGESAERYAGLGEAIIGTANGLVTADAEAAFKTALEHDPDNAKARFFIAIAHAQEGKPEEARKIWEAMKSALPENSPWRAAAIQALGDSETAGAEAAPDDAAGPSDEDIAAAADMSTGDRHAMITDMVARLDSRLRDNPKDAEGWQRLIRSYMVLEKPEDALAAFERGQNALGKDTQEAESLAAFAAGLGLRVE